MDSTIPAADAVHRPRGGVACWAPLIGRVILGGLFVTAAVLKMQDPQAFLFAVNGFKMLPPHLAYSAAFMIPWIELIAGVMLVLGLWGRAACLVLIGLLVVFIAGIANVLMHGYDTKCSCFGKVEWPCTGGVGWCQITRNVCMIAMGVPVLIWGPGAASLDTSCGRACSR